MPTKVGNVTLSDQEVEELREVFNLVDRDGGGDISAPEVLTLLTMLGLKSTPDEVDQMLAEFDTDGSGTVDFVEFL